MCQEKREEEDLQAIDDCVDALEHERAKKDYKENWVTATAM